MRRLSILTAVAVMGIAANSAQASVLVDFESTPSGAIAEGTTIGGITFTSALGDGLQVGNYTPQSQGQGLLAQSDTNGNYILGAIAGGTNFISFDFGNDDAAFVNPGDLAVLKVYLGTTLLDTISILLTPDDILNQSISYTGLFDNFSFAYTDANGSPFTGGGNVNVGLIEVIDNIVYGAVVPEPASWAMMIGGFGLVGASLRRRRTAAALA